MESEKKRSANYTTAKESLLVLLVKKDKHIIENKKTDTTTITQKNDVWIKIEKEFNAESGQIYRNALVLKKKYENIKKRGEPEETFQFNTLDSNVMELLGDARIAGLPAQFGSDADMEKFEVIVEPEEEQSLEKPDEEFYYPMKDLQEANGNSNLHYQLGKRYPTDAQNPKIKKPCTGQEQNAIKKHVIITAWLSIDHGNNKIATSDLNAAALKNPFTREL
ncbi:hypothetical protein JTB14_019688 [Gonioctena quinquepunctata]|nr:hypothetical protein JTB14_019688 [Gonioctena quinquepunctata]